MGLLAYLNYKARYERKSPIRLREAWLSRKANEWLNKNIKQEWDVLEFGSGGSTLYFSDNCRSIDSIEDQENWIYLVQNLIKKKNVKFYSKPPKKTYDLILVDGNGDRIKQFEYAKKHIKKGGFIIFDNIDRYILKDKPNIIFSDYAYAYAGITHTGVFFK